MTKIHKVRTIRGGLVEIEKRQLLKRKAGKIQTIKTIYGTPYRCEDIIVPDGLVKF